MIPRHDAGPCRDCPACTDETGAFIPGATAQHMQVWDVSDRAAITPQTFIGPLCETTWDEIDWDRWTPFVDGTHPAWSQEWIGHSPVTVCWSATCVDHARCDTQGWTLRPQGHRPGYWIGIRHAHSAHQPAMVQLSLFEVAA